MAGGGYIISNQANDIIGLSSSIATAAIVIGVIISLISFLGCFGAANEKGMLLKTYFVLLIILVILEVAVGAAAYAKRDNIDPLLQDAWRAGANSPTNNATIAQIQTTFRCCGYASVTDNAVPSNCAALTGFNVGCRESLRNNLSSSLSTIGGAGIAIGLIELVGLVFSLIMFRKISRKENAQNSLLNEAWRVNRTKVQYGYNSLMIGTKIISMFRIKGSFSH
jgi:hypothetical protein